MKNKGVITVIVFLVIIVSVVLFVRKDNDIKEGKYYAVDCVENPNGYIEVINGKIYVYNVDLNEIYQEELFKKYNTIKKHYSLGFAGYTNEQLMYYSDFNSFFSNEGYSLSETKVMDLGNNKYSYLCELEEYVFKITFIYDSKNKTIEIGENDYLIKFR